MNFRVHKSGRVELLESFHARSANPPEEIGRETGVVCHLLDTGGQSVISHHCQVVNPHMEDGDAYVDYFEALPLDTVRVEDVQAIQINQNGHVQTLDVSGGAPVVSMKAAKETKSRSTLRRIEWETTRPADSSPGYPVHYILRYSADGGTTWRALAAGLTATSYVANMDLLPGGDHCLFEVIATAGIRSATSRTKPEKIARKPRKAYILTPADKSTTIRQGEEIEFVGGGFSPEAGTTDFDEVTWYSDKDGLLGKGYQVFTNALSKGVHTVSLRFPNGLGKEASGSVSVTVA